MRIFDYSNYKKYINDRILYMPKRGRGEYRKLADYLRLNTVVISQIFKGSRELSLEQALALTKYFGLMDLEKEYFLNLVQKERAGDFELKKYFEAKLRDIKLKSQDIKNLAKGEELSEEATYQFYSNWYYSAIRLSTALPGHDNVDKISEKLKIPKFRVQQVVDFLIRHNLIVQEKGRLKIGPQKTHIGADSPYVIRHHINWRLKGMENMEDLSESEFFFTAPMVLSHDFMLELKQKILDLIADFQGKIKDVKDEKMACFNVDFFELE